LSFLFASSALHSFVAAAEHQPAFFTGSKMMIAARIFHVGPISGDTA
jgi:hypothetical protein